MQFGDTLHPPFPCLEELIFDVPGSSVNHTMSDAQGLVQFMTALGEIAQGATTLSTLPVWRRELLFARDPPRMTSFIWRCRTIALQLHPEDEMRMKCLVSARSKIKSFIPMGYYGNSFAYLVAISTARDLSNKQLGHTLEILKKTKESVTEEYMRSLVDITVIKGRPLCTVVRSYYVSDVTCVAFDVVDFGWGKPAYGGPAEGGISFMSFYVPSKNHKGASSFLVASSQAGAPTKVI
ncbi:hypothetical protein E3N88_32969 [Mikania micrantha]|uniref:Uncharacterized protein n=1 Tax=Mikania micrantha TaxID=192012 RepID=A0A5N6M9Y1_9ASTR|nr:hypothetical protein E3N88_32969 [Mikania micrantha]